MTRSYAPQVPRYLLPYVDIADAPTLTSPKSLASGSESLAGYIQNTDIGTVNNFVGKDVILKGAWNSGFIVRGLQSNPGKPVRFVNFDNSVTLGTSTLGQDTVQQVNQATNVEFYGKSLLAPMYILAGSSGVSGANWGSSPSGTSISFYNTIVKNAGYGGILCNFGTGTNVGHGWNGDLYEEVFLRHFRTHGLVSEGEGGYFGHTSATYAELERVILLQMSAMNKGREAWQGEHNRKLLAYHHTNRNVGQNTGGLLEQQNLNQIHDCGTGVNTVIVENCIFDGAPNLLNIFSHNIIYRNCYFRWTNGQPGYIGDSTTSYFAGSPRLTGVQQLYEKCYFFADNGGASVPYMNQCAEPGCNIQYKDCVSSANIGAFLQDQRVGSPANSFIGTVTTNGNTQLSWSTFDQHYRPTYISDDPDDHANYCLVSHPWFHAMGMGRRTPAKGKLNLCQVPKLATIKATYGTAFSSLTLPSTHIFCAQDAQYYSLPVSWVAGSYNPAVAGNYTITGTPVLNSQLQNSTGITASVIVTVKPAPAATKRVLINLGDTGAPPITLDITDDYWNNLTAGGSTGSPPVVQQIYGQGTGDPITSLINTEGTLTGYGLTTTSILSGGNTGQQPATYGAGVYPDDAIIHGWYNPSAGYRGLDLTGLDNTLTYTVIIMCSSATYLSSPQTANIQVIGATTSTTTAFNEYGNISSTISVSMVPSGGKITINLGTNQGRAMISVIELQYTP